MSHTQEQQRFTLSEVAADWYELTIPWSAFLIETKDRNATNYFHRQHTLHRDGELLFIREILS